jgi:CBS domain-containing protein
MQAGDIMTQVLLTMRRDTPLEDVCHLMMAHRIRSYVGDRRRAVP